MPAPRPADALGVGRAGWVPVAPARGCRASQAYGHASAAGLDVKWCLTSVIVDPARQQIPKTLTCGERGLRPLSGMRRRMDPENSHLTKKPIGESNATADAVAASTNAGRLRPDRWGRRTMADCTAMLGLKCCRVATPESTHA